MAARIWKATLSEVRAYRGVYPLYGLTKISGKVCPVEDLRAGAGSDDPKFEIMAPRGFHFADEVVHSILCLSLLEAREIAASAELVPCSASCG